MKYIDIYISTRYIFHSIYFTQWIVNNFIEKWRFHASQPVKTLFVQLVIVTGCYNEIRQLFLDYNIFVRK